MMTADGFDPIAWRASFPRQSQRSGGKKSLTNGKKKKNDQTYLTFLILSLRWQPSNLRLTWRRAFSTEQSSIGHRSKLMRSSSLFLVSHSEKVEACLFSSIAESSRDEMKMIEASLINHRWLYGKRTESGVKALISSANFDFWADSPHWVINAIISTVQQTKTHFLWKPFQLRFSRRCEKKKKKTSDFLLRPERTIAVMRRRRNKRHTKNLCWNWNLWAEFPKRFTLTVNISDGSQMRRFYEKKFIFHFTFWFTVRARWREGWQWKVRRVLRPLCFSERSRKKVRESDKMRHVMGARYGPPTKGWL